MKRLREMPASSPLIDQAQRLIEAAPPIPESSATTARMQRIRRALDQPRASGASLLPRVPAVALAGALLLFGASAFAAVRTLVERLVARPAAAKLIEAPREPSTREQSAPEASPQLMAAAEPAREALSRAPLMREARRQLSAADGPRRNRAQPTRRASRQLSADTRLRARVQSAGAPPPSRGGRRHDANRATRSSASPATVPTTSAVAASRATAPWTAPVTGSRTSAPSAAAESVSRATAPRTAAESASHTTENSDATDELAAIPEPARMSRAAKRSSDSELVVRAVQTLRRDHDPAVASRLLERYRTRNPAGVLAEEVLSLQVEAAVAAGDPRADSFAREYLARYPDGRYRERAARALGGGAP